MSPLASRQIGIDVGGTDTKWVVLENGTPQRSGRTPTPREGGEGLLVVLNRLIRELDAEPEAIGLALPGFVNTRTRSTVFLPNLPGEWADFPIGERLERDTGAVVYVLNDARAFGHAELLVGAGQGERNALFLTLGTGVGGAIAREGSILVGEVDAIGEMGHVSVVVDGEQCGCGGRGCLETVASGSAIVASVTRAFLTSLSQELNHVTGNELAKLTPEAIASAARAGDVWALAAFERAGRYLGAAAGDACALMQLNSVIVGGGLSPAFEFFAPSMRAVLSQRTSVLGEVSVRKAKWGVEAGAIGAALYAGIRFSEPKAAGNTNNSARKESQ